MEKKITIQALRDVTLEVFLKEELNLTKKQISQAKFRPMGICVNGQQKRINENVVAGDWVSVLLELDEKGSNHLISNSEELSILYEDDDLIIIDKPAGIVVHPSHGHYSDSIANRLVYYFRQKNQNIQVRAIGRLDKETSGVLIFAKNQVSAARLAMQKEQGVMKKEYLAIVHGIVENDLGTICKAISKDLDELSKMKISEDGKKAITHYQVLEKGNNWSLISLKLETGRTHQIRVHMKSLGHPLIGDLIYGQKDDVIQRAALHAWRVQFQQPFSCETLIVEAPIPEDLGRFLTIEKNGQKCHNINRIRRQEGCL